MGISIFVFLHSSNMKFFVLAAVLPLIAGDPQVPFTACASGPLSAAAPAPVPVVNHAFQAPLALQTPVVNSAFAAPFFQHAARAPVPVVNHAFQAPLALQTPVVNSGFAAPFFQHAVRAPVVQHSALLPSANVIAPFTAFGQVAALAPIAAPVPVAAPAPLVAHAPFAAIKPFVHHGLPSPFGRSPCSCSSCQSCFPGPTCS